MNSLARWMEATSGASQQSLLETQWGNMVPLEEYPQNDWPDGMYRPGTFYSQTRDRADGRFLPVYDTEIDLLRQRAVCRALAELEGIGKGAATAMCNYTIGTGIKISVASAKDQVADESTLSEVRRFIHEFCDENDVVGIIDREIDEYERQDGERTIVLKGNACELSLAIIEPEWITEPGNSRELEEWLNCDFVSSWSFGVHTKAGEPSKPLGYHVVYDDRNYDYFPAERVEMWKKNVPSTAKRGVSDFLPVYRDINREAKLSGNLALGSTARAAIAWIEQLAAGQGKASAEGQQIDSILNRQMNGGVKQVRMKSIDGGTVKTIPSGKEFKPGPDGPSTEGNLSVAQYLLRRIGVRWSAPEYLISGDASNNNMASALVAESPFVKGREADQGGHRSHWVKLLWKAVRIGYEAGMFGLDIPWGVIRRSIEIAIDFPDVASRNEKELTDAIIAQRDAGFISDQTGSNRLGNDYDQEKKQGAKRVAAAQPQFGVPALESSRSTVGNLLRQEWNQYP